MPINTSELISLVADVTREANVQVAFRESLRGGVITGLSSVVGALMLGPVGFAVGL